MSVVGGKYMFGRVCFGMVWSRKPIAGKQLGSAPTRQPRKQRRHPKLLEVCELFLGNERS
jgi:hypothetical protein